MYCLTVLKAVTLKPKCHQVWFFLRALREESVLGLSPWLTNYCLLPVSLQIIFPLWVFLSKFPLFIRIQDILD